MFTCCCCCLCSFPEAVVVVVILLLMVLLLLSELYLLLMFNYSNPLYFSRLCYLCYKAMVGHRERIFSCLAVVAVAVSVSGKVNNGLVTMDKCV